MKMIFQLLGIFAGIFQMPGDEVSARLKAHRESLTPSRDKEMLRKDFHRISKDMVVATTEAKIKVYG